MQPNAIEHELERDLAHAVGLGVAGACLRVIVGVVVLTAIFTWLLGGRCSSDSGSADRAIEAAGQRQVAAALQQHQQTLRAMAAVKDAEETRILAERAIRFAEASHDRARIVNDTTVDVRSALDGLTTRATVPVQITQRFNADSVAIERLKLTVVKQGIAIAELLATVAADSNVIRTQAEQIDAWRAKKSPRCGRKCGIALGVTGTVLVAAAVNTVRNAFTARRSMVAMSWRVP